MMLDPDTTVGPAGYPAGPTVLGRSPGPM